MSFTRRSLLLGLVSLGVLWADSSEARRRRSASRRSSRRSSKAAPKIAETPAAPPKPKGRALPIPPIVDLASGQTATVEAVVGSHAFLDGQSVPVAGYTVNSVGGGYMGPVIRIARGAEVGVRIVNGMDRPTNVHWHGLLVDGASDGGSHPGIAPGEAWDSKLSVDQPAATLWYHAHIHGSVADDILSGLAGMLLVDDEASKTVGLPSTWGVDDIPLILQDRDFDDQGRPVYERTQDVMDHGFRGRRIIVNGITEPVATVPQRLVRFRVLNAANARVFRIYCQDERPFQLIGTDGGLLPAPVEVHMVALAPGERVEILIDFGDGGTALMSTPDIHEHRMGAHIMQIPDVIEAPFRLVAFDAVADSKPKTKLPAALAELPEPLPKTAARRRRFELQMIIPVPKTPGQPLPQGKSDLQMHMHHAASGGASAPGPIMAINGATFDPARIDIAAKLGETEIWEIVAPEMGHPFHMHGAQFRVLSEDGKEPKQWNLGVKDTVFVENSAELLVTFTRTATNERPFVYHCHVLEHEDAGMMGTYTVE